MKWTTAAESPSDGPRYLIANGDEGDPGSFVDRLLMEQDPHGVLEGMALAALAAGATRGYVYVRSEYPRARHDASGDRGGPPRRPPRDGVRRRGVRGRRVLRGRRGDLADPLDGGPAREAAPRPPYPTERGLYGRPTVVNNVETLAAVPWIVARGGDAYAELGLGDSHGTKVVCLNERFERPGAYEVELGPPCARSSRSSAAG